MNIIYIASITRYIPGTDEMYTEIIVNFEDDDMKYLRFTYPLSKEVCAEGFRELADKIEAK
jgi:hypothetical protein